MFINLATRPPVALMSLVLHNFIGCRLFQPDENDEISNTKKQLQLQCMIPYIRCKTCNVEAETRMYANDFTLRVQLTTIKAATTRSILSKHHAIAANQRYQYFTANVFNRRRQKDERNWAICQIVRCAV